VQERGGVTRIFFARDVFASHGENAAASWLRDCAKAGKAVKINHIRHEAAHCDAGAESSSAATPERPRRPPMEVAMSIAMKLQKYLDRKQACFNLIEHQPTKDAMSAADVCRVYPDCVAKAVVVRSREGYLLAVLPASQRISLLRLQEALGQPYALATEGELDRLFDDCVHGAVPPIGECYGLDVVAETSLFDSSDIYFEGGDLKTLVHMSQAQFSQLSDDARRAHFAAALE
jgi:Ala-tRNA(Pro) deacylase